MLMLSTEVVVKLFQLPEESSMLPNIALHQDSKNQSSCAKFKPLMMQWEVFIKLLLKEEVLLWEKNQFKELLLLSSRPSYQSLSLSDSPNI